jgi:hypothetical protein
VRNKVLYPTLSGIAHPYVGLLSYDIVWPASIFVVRRSGFVLLGFMQRALFDKANAETRVTRLGEFSPIVRLFSLGSFL